jgi:hypothetical protein
MQTKVAILKDVFGMLREFIIVLALAAFIFMPASVNNILKAAGFTSGSIGGFEWKAEIVASAQTNQDAQEQILKLGSWKNNLARFRRLSRALAGKPRTP